ncbi:hypothetical protein [Amnibacterium endophyticum]|uniref:Anti-sigma factor n=1 Tax=Amnibacterium endophyticum TaxID=2109337 RepID=A0ABW4LAU7_9MICO
MSGAEAGPAGAADDEGLLERFAAAYEGRERPEAALDHVLETRRSDDRDAGTVWAREDATRRRLYAPGATPEGAAEHRRLAAAAAEEDALARSAYAAARKGAPAVALPGPAADVEPRPSPPPRTGRRRVLLTAAGAAVVVLVAAGIAVMQQDGARADRALPERPVVVGRTIPLHGTPAQVERLRRAIHGATEGEDALITVTAIAEIPVLRDATRLSENDVTGSGNASLTVPDMDAFHRQRSATVLLFCATPAAWTWTLHGTVGRGAEARTWRQRGRGADCGRLSVATVPLPPDLHETTLTARAEHGARLIAMLETVG